MEAYDEEVGAELEVYEPDAILPAQRHLTTTKRIERPDWLGLSAEHRRVAKHRAKEHAGNAGHRVVYELISFKGGMPRRAWNLLRWFFIGVRIGWPEFVAWLFAVDERREVRDNARMAPVNRAAAPRKGLLRTGAGVDHLVWWRCGLTLGLVPLALAYGLQKLVQTQLEVLLTFLQSWAIVVGVLVGVPTVVIGARNDFKPAPTYVAPRRREDVTENSMTEALRAVGELAKPTKNNPAPEGVTLARLPIPVGIGHQYVFDLPASAKGSARTVIAKREEIASSFGIDLAQFLIERGSHAGQIVVWMSEVDPFSTAPVQHPLLDAESWSVFDRVPFGLDARSRELHAALFETHWLIGAVPGAGKTMALRILTAAVVLDKYADIYCFDGKQGKDLFGLKPIATVFSAADIPTQTRLLCETLEVLMAEGDRRFRAMQSMPDDEVPENKITPRMAANGFGFQWLIIDEGHNHLEDEENGERLLDLLIRYVKGYRAVGFGLVFCTQDPGGDLAKRFTSLRRVIKSRFAMQVMDWQASNMVLGDSMNTKGYDASIIRDDQKGTGILRGDSDVDGQTDAVARMLRCYYMDNLDWSQICEQGRQLRGGLMVDAPVRPTGPVYATPTELFALLAERAPDVLGAVEADTVQKMGQRLPLKGTQVKKDRKRVYDLVKVEPSLGLSPGCLTAVSGPSEDDEVDDWDTADDDMDDDIETTAQTVEDEED